MKKPIIILTGPTAVGKTSLSINLAQKINGEIISADSMQVYKHMDIGTAKVTKAQMDGVKHYLIDILEPDEEFNVVKFKSYALEALNEIYKKGKTPIVVGGTGFYIQALLYDIIFDETDTKKLYRHELEQLAKDKGNMFLHNMLREVDSVSASKIHPNNVKRVIRALEYYKETNRTISRHNAEQSENESPYNFSYFVLNDKREDIYSRINQRVDQMISDGLVKEVSLLKEKGYSKDMISMQGIGYKEVLDYLGDFCTLDEAIDNIKKDTRHFAKRQITWFRREKEVTWININEFDNKNQIIQYILQILNERGIYNE